MGHQMNYVTCMEGDCENGALIARLQDENKRLRSALNGARFVVSELKKYQSLNCTVASICGWQKLMKGYDNDPSMVRRALLLYSEKGFRLHQSSERLPNASGAADEPSSNGSNGTS
jgi:hypothetical protein